MDTIAILSYIKLRPFSGEFVQARLVPLHNIGVVGVAAHEILMLRFGRIEITGFELGGD